MSGAKRGTSRRAPREHPSLPGTRLYGRRVLLRPLVPPDFPSWSEIRRRNDRWLTPWEPHRPPGQPDPAHDRDAFTVRCLARDRERQSGTGYAFGLFVDHALAGEVNLNNVVRGAMQSATVGYWIDQDRAGRSYVAEGVVVLGRHAFEALALHRLEVCIIPRNTNSRRVMEKLQFREEGVAERFLEINGTWEDHVRYAITAEEWEQRRDELGEVWL
jgi:[ribosomal protein S5]-alanine N-acetyltransferase